jgi:hypothetical protein
MPTPAKPCDGRFSDEILEILSRNRDRAQWANHPCEVCGLAIGATLVRGKWVPEQHWPSVKLKYTPRNPVEKKQNTPAGVMTASDEIVLAKSAYR